jgi:hypothetical protein
MEIGNNYLIDDYDDFKQEIKIDFSDKLLELKYFLRNKEEVEHFFEQIDSHISKIESIKEKYNFKKIFCRFYFGKFNLSLQEIKKLIDFQNQVFDFISIQKFGRYFNKFEQSYEYAKDNYKKPISLILDIRDYLFDFKQSLDYLKEWDISMVRFIYGKIDTHFSKYFQISQVKKEIPFYLTACSKRCIIKSIEDKRCSNIPVSILSKSKLLNFDGSCMDYLPRSKTHKGQRFIPPETISFFNPKTLLWEERENDKTFKKQRILDFQNLNQVKVNETILNNNSTINRVMKYLNSLDH